MIIMRAETMTMSWNCEAYRSIQKQTRFIIFRWIEVSRYQ